MFTSAECRAFAEQKIAEADRNERHRIRFINAAQAWLILASQLRRIEASYTPDASLTKKHSRKRALVLGGRVVTKRV
jgi:hypothetical protein